MALLCFVFFSFFSFGFACVSEVRHIYRNNDNKENFNPQNSDTDSQSLYLSGRRTDLPLLVLHGNFTFFKSPFALDLHSFGDWFFRVLACNDILWSAEVDPFRHPRLGDE